MSLLHAMVNYGEYQHCCTAKAKKYYTFKYSLYLGDACSQPFCLNFLHVSPSDTFEVLFSARTVCDCIFFCMYTNGEHVAHMTFTSNLVDF